MLWLVLVLFGMSAKYEVPIAINVPKL